MREALASARDEGRVRHGDIVVVLAGVGRDRAPPTSCA